MRKAKESDSTPAVRRHRPASTPEAREQQLIAKAVNLAERQLDEGTASSQVITHFLKLATEKEKLEREKIKLENELAKAKTEALQSAKNIEELYKDAITAMRGYAGGYSEDEYYEY